MHDKLFVGRVIGMHECGKSKAWISRHLNVSRTSVVKWCSEFRRTGGLVRKKSTGWGCSVHVWGAVWHGGKSDLQVLVRSVNGQYYCDVLRLCLNGDRLPPDGWTLKQDNAPARRS